MMRKWFYAGIFLVAAGSLVSAATFSWKVNTTGGWFTDGNWNQSGYPSAGDTVMITNLGSYVILSNTTASLAGLTLGDATANQRTLSFTNWETCLYATNITVLTNGYITCAGPFTNNVMSNRVNLACSNLIINGGGERIDLETISRSVTLSRSDYMCGDNFDPIAGQVETFGLAYWVPLSATLTGKRPGDTYNVRSCMSAGMSIPNFSCIAG